MNEYRGEVFFIRAAIDFDIERRISAWVTPEQRILSVTEASELKAALRSLFPDLHFTLIIINYLEELPAPLELEEGIVEFKFVRNGDKDATYAKIIDRYSNLQLRPIVSEADSH